MTIFAILRAGAIVAFEGLLVLCAVAFMARTGEKRDEWRDILGWHVWHPSWVFWVGTFGSVLYGAGVTAVMTRFSRSSQGWAHVPEGRLVVGLYVGLVVLLGPLVEELLYRGPLFTVLRRLTGARFTIGATALLFALGHLERSPAYTLAIFPVGVFLGVLRERDGSLKACLTAHILYNGAAMAIMLAGY